MNYTTLIKSIREDFALKQHSFTKEELRYCTGKDSFRGKMLGCLTFSYYKRGKLFKNGRITYALAFREWFNRLEDNRPRATWVLFSPSSEFDTNPEVLFAVRDNLQQFIARGKPERKYHKLFVALTGELSEPSYMEIPSEFSNGHLVYLSSLYLRQNQIPCFHLGINLILSDIKTSKEVVYLPLIYWSKDFEQLYKQINANIEK